MQSKMDFGTWTQIVTGAAVVLGLILVIVELRQMQAISRAQFSSDLLVGRMDREMVIVGENFAETLTKACLEPETLTPADMRALDSYYSTLEVEMYRFAALTYRDGIYAEDYLTNRLASSFAQRFDTAYGRAWIAVRLESFEGPRPDPLLTPLIPKLKRGLQETGPVVCKATYEKIKKTMQAYLEVE